ncbi:exodeoxyribonuclease V subunit gamma [Erwinia pyrifoliae]|uniref:exodeoxyribonuclease V subunit gamma n=1 Tax=Erwinia pyrifoliae TaxID=79967 RepID=UPI0001961324|nr:exodeoxyribonuclease V subunit gamma [Erwinia pyrifoliae]AUX71724.1 exonuclease V subunit gamma [Erwinia pyrifoliae]MCA8878046.1 exodeoxyribonuclease V subunit gamma [Erwinia pyrifoliae]CAX56646.1 Exodeoxyribonuclease V gamma chain [Erwinia pyrifoliae Ep1/96]CAY75482.1 recC [Erwinia pyrifoliae DSM 12163]
MFHVYHSNQLDVLKMLACWQIENQPLRDPLRSEVVLVQSPGMAQWLQMSLAEEFKIAANIDFPLPASFIWDMFVRVLPEIPKESAFNKSSMSWKLMAILPGMLPGEAFTMLRHYLSDDDDKRKLFQLASRVADLFDQYLVYRPQWLNGWEKGQLTEGLGDAQIWQAPLWAALVEYTRRLGQPEWHRANLYRRFISRLENSSTRPPNLPDRVFICGISALPPVYLQALQALGKHIEIYLLFTNPCRHYWADIQDYAFLAKLQSRHRRHYQDNRPIPQFRDADNASSLFNDAGEQQLSNPLLAFWGKLGRDNLYLLADMEPDEVFAFVDIEPINLLQTLKRDLLELEDHAVIGLLESEWENSRSKRVLNADDRSVEIHLCHSPQREVEVLQDRLLAMMADDPKLTARDIIVMVADIDAYTPFIQAVFGNAPADRAVPFAISDRRASQAHPALQAFISLLSLPDSRFTAEEVLALLEVPAVASRFAIDEEGLSLLRHWVAESGVRWGLDDDSVRELDLPATGQHTWHFGLTRMLLGYAMNSEAGDWQGILPFDESSGLIAELAGNLAELLMQLNRWQQWLSEPRELDSWLPLCRRMLDDFFNSDAETDAALALIEEQWQQAINYGVQAGYRQAVPLTLLRDELSSRLDQQRISQRFLAGPVNFCTLMPMRSIPFKVVCLLGMNDGVYPRTLPPLGFDLMSQQLQKGDRSRRDDDRYLFLEALNSAQQQLYISYIARSIQDNTERYPSVLVSELVEYISQSFCLAEDSARDVDSSAEAVVKHLHHLHSRMPFAAENFSPQAEFRSFAAEWLPAASGQGTAHPPFMRALPEESETVIGFDKLVRFWRHPVRAFFSLRLGVSFQLEETGLPDAEPFSLDGLSRYQVNSLLLNSLIDGNEGDKLYTRQRAAGVLPYGAFGELFWQEQEAEMSELAAQVREQRAAAENWEISLTLGGVTLSGWLAQVQDNGLLRWRPGKLNVKDGLALWLEHLVYCAMGGSGSSLMLGREKSVWRFPPLAADAAQQQLVHYIGGYRQGMRAPLLLTASGGAWLKACFDQKTGVLQHDEATQKQARGKLLQCWQGNYQVEGEGSDPYLQRLLRRLDDDSVQEMIAQAERWLLPLLLHHQPD